MPTEASSETAGEVSLACSAAEEISSLSPGEMLSDARAQRNLTQREVAETLHITMHYVIAIENDDLDKLPGAVFAKGYIKRYAEIMALDEITVMAAYEGLGYANSTAITGAVRKSGKARRGGKSLWVVAASVLALISLFPVLWVCNGQDSDPPQDSVELLLSELSQSTSPAQPVTYMPAAPADSGSASRRAATAVWEAQSLPLVSPQQGTIDRQAVSGSVNRMKTNEEYASGAGLTRPATVIEGEGKGTLKLSFSGTSWVEVRDSGEGYIYRDLGLTGDVLEIKGRAPFELFLGDASYTRLYLNGGDIDLSQEIRIDNSVQLTVGL